MNKRAMKKNEEPKTPYFVIDVSVLDAGVDSLRRALDASWSNNIIGYSYKTNSLPWVVTHMNELGCYAEVVSDDEYLLAQHVGVAPDSVIYNGIAKSHDTFLKALEDGAIVNIDAGYEISWLDDYAGVPRGVGLRVNFDLESLCPGHAHGGVDGSRFGFCYENGELRRAIERVVDKGFAIDGLHLHKSSKTRLPEVYFAIAKTAVKIAREFELKLKYVDIGGGFFGGLPSKPQFPEYFEGIAAILRSEFTSDEVCLVVEPGMAVIGPPISYVTTVVDVKHGLGTDFVVTDGSRVHIDPLMTKSSYFYEHQLASGFEHGHSPRQVVTGYTCMENDRIFEIIDGDAAQPSDVITYQKVGAYTMCLSPAFIKWLPDVYVKDWAGMHQVKQRWDAEQFMNANTCGGWAR